MTNERINRIPKSQQTLLRDSLAIQRSAKPEMRHAISRTLAVLVVAIAGFAHGMTASGGEDEVRLADNGKASAIIVVSAQTMNWGGLTVAESGCMGNPNTERAMRSTNCCTDLAAAGSCRLNWTASRAIAPRLNTILPKPCRREITNSPFCVSAPILTSWAPAV